MARNEEVVITGKSKFSFINRLSPFGKWSQGIYLDTKSLGVVQQLIKDGVKNVLNQDDDGYWIAFSRPPEKLTRTGQRYSLQPPVCVDKDGKAYLGAIGAGSDIAVRLEVYGGKNPVGGQYKAARLGGVKIYNLIPYEPETMSDNPHEVKAAQALSKAPEPTDTW